MRFQLRYLSARNAAEMVDADDADEAEDLARRRLLFHDPGFAIAVLFEGVELTRVTQRSKPIASPSVQATSLAEIDHGQG